MMYQTMFYFYASCKSVYNGFAGMREQDIFYLFILEKEFDRREFVVTFKYLHVS